MDKIIKLKNTETSEYKLFANKLGAERFLRNHLNYTYAGVLVI